MLKGIWAGYNNEGCLRGRHTRPERRPRIIVNVAAQKPAKTSGVAVKTMAPALVRELISKDAVDAGTKVVTGSIRGGIPAPLDEVANFLEIVADKAFGDSFSCKGFKEMDRVRAERKLRDADIAATADFHGSDNVQYPSDKAATRIMRYLHAQSAIGAKLYVSEWGDIGSEKFGLVLGVQGRDRCSFNLVRVVCFNP